eukprot:CAMPEP_0204515546 /NCGR_PEP_ID=MMETSP0661-20131031/2676_1 /ASSEMBLY_ACC=CAM_ASM_000606 /TAXON_ID=109239 /ORGANISM="Alexandrium margalefi, Strain AMGDE01CS-322" /LENGTH=432 /DNA_ID=CAMNT_0051520869 /DNA_START=1 /DNA_END=1296 /DNA_ORIENTATION=-
MLFAFAEDPLNWPSAMRVSRSHSLWLTVTTERWFMLLLDAQKVMFGLLYRAGLASAPPEASYTELITLSARSNVSMARHVKRLAELRGHHACDHACLLDSAAAYAALAYVAASRGDINDLAAMLDESQELFQTAGFFSLSDFFEDAEWRPLLTALWGVLASVSLTPFVRSLRDEHIQNPFHDRIPRVTSWRDSGFAQFCPKAKPLDHLPPAAVLGLYRMLDTVGRLLTWHGLTWFVSHGTLLGALRHGGIIPHDCDVDITVPMSEAKLLRSSRFLDALARNGYELAFRPVQHLFAVFRLGAPIVPSGWQPQLYAPLEPTLNIYIVCSGDDKQDWFEYLTNRDIHGNIHLPKFALFPTRTAPFGTSQVNVPADPDLVLDAMYGRDWRSVIRDLSARVDNDRWNPLGLEDYGPPRMALPAGPLRELELPVSRSE